MDPFALKHAIHEVESEIERADMIPHYDGDKMIDWAFRILLIAEIKQLNTNIQRLTDVVRRIK